MILDDSFQFIVLAILNANQNWCFLLTSDLSVKVSQDDLYCSEFTS